MGSFASSHLKSQLSMRTWLALANLLASLFLGAWFFLAVVLGLTLSAGLFWVVGVGVALLSGTLRLGAGMAGIDRNRIEHLTGRHITPAELPLTPPGLSLRERQRRWATAVPVRRLAAYQLVRPTVVSAAIFAIVTWTWIIVDLLMWATGSRSALRSEERRVGKE